jgi:integrase
VKLTKDAAATLPLPPNKTDHIEWDDTLPGFGLRLRRAHRSWICQYRIGRQQRRESLGDIRKVGLEAARAIARKRFAQVELGVDPKVMKGKTDADAAAMRLTLAVVAERYLEFKQPLLRPSSYAAARSYFAIHWEPLATRPLVNISRADVAARLQEITKEHGRVSASRARTNLSALFSWAMKEALCEANPVLITNDPGAGIKPRERVLDADEIKAIWGACGDDDFSVIVKLLVLTGQRRNEIAGLHWSEIDFSAGLIRLPSERVKNAHPHNIPMSGAVIGILAARLNAHGSARDLLFGKRDRMFMGWTNAKAKLDRKIAATGKALAPWTLHDLRRTCATGMAEDLDIEPHIIEACLNHQSGHKRGVAGTYNRALYERATRIALAQWGERVLDIVEGRASKVVPMMRGA